MKIAPDAVIADVRHITPVRHADERGYFSEVVRRDRLIEAGIDLTVVQENHSLSRAPGTLRGLHFQVGAAAQAKLVRCPHGRILDVAVDLRRASPTFGRHVVAELSGDNWAQVYIPAGFAHGFCTLEPGSEVIYLVDAPYDPAAERGVRYDDPDLAIGWPRGLGPLTLSPKDRDLPSWRDLPAYF